MQQRLTLALVVSISPPHGGFSCNPFPRVAWAVVGAHLQALGATSRFYPHDCERSDFLTLPERTVVDVLDICHPHSYFAVLPMTLLQGFQASLYPAPITTLRRRLSAIGERPATVKW